MRRGRRRRRRKEYKPMLLGAIIQLENNTHPPAFFIFSLTLFVRLGYLPPKGFPSDPSLGSCVIPTWIGRQI
jgi:hypothetical protein